MRFVVKKSILMLLAAACVPPCSAQVLDFNYSRSEIASELAGVDKMIGPTLRCHLVPSTSSGTVKRQTSIFLPKADISQRIIRTRLQINAASS
jgi:hypothetical protein